MNDIIVLIIIVAIVFLAIRYIYKQKKAGVVCIGCPHGASCSNTKKKSDCNCKD